jgi:hypothetical protein
VLGGGSVVDLRTVFTPLAHSVPVADEDS